jgi:hypothetical protein
MNDVDQDLLHAIETNNSDDVIEHFGIKGMKWGFRRSLSKLPQSRTRRAQKESKAARKAWNMKYHKRHSMTERDLQAATRRLRMENDFAEQVRRANQIADTRKPKKEHGKFAKDLGRSVANSVIDTGVKTVVGDLMKNKSNKYSPVTNTVLGEIGKLRDANRSALDEVRRIWS